MRLEGRHHRPIGEAVRRDGVAVRFNSSRKLTVPTLSSIHRAMDLAFVSSCTFPRQPLEIAEVTLLIAVPLTAAQLSHSHNKSPGSGRCRVDLSMRGLGPDPTTELMGRARFAAIEVLHCIV